MRGRPKTHEWCTKKGCFNSHYAKGLCQKHYRSMQHRFVNAAVKAKRCTAPRCEDTKFRDGDYCLAHTLEREYHDRDRVEAEDMLPPEEDQ